MKLSEATPGSFFSFFSLQTFHFKRHITPWLGAALLLLSVQPGVSWAQAANDVICNKCVDKSDIAKNAITSNRIENVACSGLI